MGVAEGVRGAFGTIRAYPMRAFFTVLGTLVGVAFMIAVVTILEGMSSYVETRLIGRFFGYNTVTLRRAPEADRVASETVRRSWSRHAPLTMADARWIAGRMRTPGVLSAGWTGSAPARAPGGRALGRVVVSGTTATHFHVHSLRVAEGRPFSEREAERGLPVATRMFFVVMLALSSVGLLVGGVGVVAIMTISVTERTREIGVRKALGATRRAILWQFLVETVTVTVGGGAVGIALAGGGALLLARLTPVPAQVPLWSVVAGLAVSAGCGLVFGIAPANRAARLDPVEALRHQ